MIKIRRSTQTVVAFAEEGEMFSFENEAEATIAVPKWVVKLTRLAVRAKTLARLEMRAWKSNASFVNKLCYGHKLYGAV